MDITRKHQQDLDSGLVAPGSKTVRDLPGVQVIIAEHISF